MYDAIVIGAGNGGMTGALNLAKAGKKVLLLERHIVPGGAGSTFVRGRFEFDVGLHTLWGVGTKEKPGRLGKVFTELGIMDKVEFVPQHELFYLNLLNSIKLAVSNERAAYLRKVKLLSFSPKQAKGIERYQQLLDGLAEEFYRLYEDLDGEISEKTYPLLFQYGTKNAAEVMSGYFSAKLPKLIYGMNAAYQGFANDLKDMPLIYHAFLYELAGAWHVKGGAQSIANALLDEFERCGGTAIFNAEVVHIDVRDGKVCGVRLADGRTFETDHVLCNANKVRAYIDYLDDDAVGEATFKKLRLSKPSISMFCFYMGMNCSAEELGIQHGISYMLDKNAPARGAIPGVPAVEQYGNLMYMSCYNVDDPDYSEPGTCVISCLTKGSFDDWNALSQEEYVRVKDRVTEQGVELLCKFYPKVRDHIEVLESSTPVTHRRYLGSMGGSIYSSSGTITEFLTNKLDATSEIGGLYFCGASVIAGGFNSTYLCGKAVSDLMLRHW